MEKDVLILGIESSCDETSIAVVKNGRDVLSNVVSSQIDIHKLYGGVVPEIASRNHVLCIDNVCKQALKDANVTMQDIDAIAVTYGAGLLGALIVGVNFAKALSYKYDKPLIAVNHIEAHVCANFIEHKDLKPPFACLIVSGGHTAICKMETYTSRKLIGTTVDDAIGEAFDKVARECGLEYPGGPNVDRLAKEGKKSINFVVKPKEKLKDFNFSYSGLKTAVINYIHNKHQRGEEVNIADVCRSFEDEAVEQVVYKSIEACKKFGFKTLVLAGGVSANTFLRERATNEGAKFGIKVLYPPIKLCTDNAAMVGSAGYFSYIENKNIADNKTLAPSATISL